MLEDQDWIDLNGRNFDKIWRCLKTYERNDEIYKNNKILLNLCENYKHRKSAQFCNTTSEKKLRITGYFPVGT